ncbi:MAG: molybdopterin-dependent oxidoreductase [Bacteroidota bacterium]
MNKISKKEETIKKVICSTCDIHCSVKATIKNGRVIKVSQSDNPLFKGHICMKGVYAPKAFAHPDRIRYPLKRVGERGNGKWERVSWEEAMSDITTRLKKIVAEHGPEGLGVSTSSWNTSTDMGLGRRFMNLLGAPNWTSGVALCMGNTSAINRMVCGWYPFPDYNMTNCIVLFGHNPRRHSWVPEYQWIRQAQQRGAKLIVLDPRRSHNAENADLWLPLKIGTDTVMMMGWLKIIIENDWYDKEFVKKYTHGFDELKERLEEYPIERVVEITGVKKELIYEAAKIYATSGPSIIPWTPITDQQRNSTSAIRLQASLKAICGYLDVPGGERMHGFTPFAVSQTEISMFDAISQEQKDKQLGSDKYPAFTFKGAAAELKEPTEKVWGLPYADIVMGNHMTVPSALFRAMAHGDPYPVKAFFALGNNTLMSYANMQLIYEGMMNQDLVVVQEHIMTPTAQLADYVLPGDAWLERPSMFDSFEWVPMLKPSQQAMQPPGECRSTFAFWCDIARRMGFGEYFPWETIEDFYDYRLSKSGMTWKEFSENYEMLIPPTEFKKYERTGFATPTGKVELYSTILEKLGFDPLPYYREDPHDSEDFPLRLFNGVREDGYFQTGGRHIPELRKRYPEPNMFISPADAVTYGVNQGEWVEIESVHGKVKMIASVRDDMPDGLIRIPHGWWKPETEQGKKSLSSAWELSDAQLCPDDDDYLDREQGIPHFKGIPCRINKLKTSYS